MPLASTLMTPALMIAPLAMPPEDTISAPPRRIAILSIPSTTSDPPVRLVTLVAVPPAETVTTPPLTVAVDRAPLDRTLMVPVLSVAPLAMPPEDTIWVPPRRIDAL